MVMPTPQRQQGLDESAMALATLNRLAVLRNQAQHRALTEEEQAELDEGHPPCIHCGGHHVRACPRVRRIVFRQGGAGVQEVEYWPASEIDWTGVIFEDVGGDEEPPSSLPTDVTIVLDGLTEAGENLIPGEEISEETRQAARRLVLWLDSIEP
jgi:hypothetical protein